MGMMIPPALLTGLCPSVLLCISASLSKRHPSSRMVTLKGMTEYRSDREICAPDTVNGSMLLSTPPVALKRKWGRRRKNLRAQSLKELVGIWEEKTGSRHFSLAKSGQKVNELLSPKSAATLRKTTDEVRLRRPLRCARAALSLSKISTSQPVRLLIDCPRVDVRAAHRERQPVDGNEYTGAPL